MRRTCLLFIGLFFCQSAHAFTLSNFQQPESVAVDPEDGSYYVSNIVGEFTKKDGNGYISKVNSKGNLVIQKFIGSKSGLLDAPKGLLISGMYLAVSDIDHVKVFNKSNGVLIKDIDLTSLGAKFLNDITADNLGRWYVSDTLANKIFKIEPQNDYNSTLFKSSSMLGSPNGLIFNPKSRNLMVVTWETGQLLEIDPMGGIHVLKKGLKTLDGVDVDNDGNVYISSYEPGLVYRVSLYGRGSISSFLAGLTSPADITFDRKRNALLIPSLKSNTVSSYAVKSEAVKPTNKNTFSLTKLTLPRFKKQ